MKKLVIAALFVIGAVAVATSTAKANDNVIAEQEQKQELEQKTETTCKFGSYGQDSECHVKTTQKAKQSQSQKVLGAQDVIHEGGKVHIPVNTAMDTKTAVAAMSLTMISGLAYAAKRKIV